MIGFRPHTELDLSFRDPGRRSNEVSAKSSEISERTGETRGRPHNTKMLIFDTPPTYYII